METSLNAVRLKIRPYLDIPQYYLPLLLRYPIKPINNLIYLFIRYRDLPFDLFTFCGGGREDFFLCSSSIRSTRETSLSWIAFSEGVVEVDGVDRELFYKAGFVRKIATPEIGAN